MNRVVAFKLLKKALLYSIVGMLTAWLSQKLDILPNTFALGIFHLCLWVTLVVSMFLTPYTLFRFIRADAFDRWAYAGLISAIPAVFIWCWIGPSNFLNPSLTDVTTDASYGIAHEIYEPNYELVIQRSMYPQIQPWSTSLSIEAVEQHLSMVASDNGWVLVAKSDNEWVYQAFTGGLAYRYYVVVRITEKSYGLRVDVRALTQEAPVDYGYVNELVLTLRRSF